MNSKINSKKIIIMVLLTLFSVAITALVYLTGGVKYVYTHLMYIPIVIAGFMVGYHGAVVLAIISGLLIGPFMPIDIQTMEQQLFYNWFFRLLVFVIIGSLTGLAHYINQHQKKIIDQSLYFHNHLKIPNPNILSVTDFSVFGPKVLITTILIHNTQLIIDTFNQEFFAELLETIYNDLNENLDGNPIILQPTVSNTFWMVSGHDHLDKLVDELEDILSKQYHINHMPVYFDYSLGFKFIDNNHERLNVSVFNSTNIAAKEAHEQNSKYVLVTEKNEDKSLDYFVLTDIKKALKNHETFLLFQPKVSTCTNEIKLEALIRWQHPLKGLIPPMSFIPIVEETKLINDLTLWVLKQVIVKIKYFQSNGVDASISLNVSSKNLFSDEFLREASYLIETCGFDPKNIEFEITESAAMRYKDQTEQVIKKLRKLGIKIAIDDFGKGFSSLSYLTMLNVDYIKLDKGFIDYVTTDEIKAQIVEYTINLSHKLGYKVVCEGVESQEQYELLKKLKSDYIQGFYVSKPEKAENILTWAKNRMNLS